MNRSLPAVLVVSILAAPSLAVAQTAGERLPSDVRPGQMVSVVEDDGRKIEGRVREISERGLVLSRRGTNEEVLLDRIVRIDKPDSLKNGALAGLGVGLALSAVTVLAQPDGMQPEWVFAAVAYNGIAFTLLGTGIDALVDSRRTLYERGRRPQVRLAPVVGPGTRGAVVSWTW
jgi:hypothetical protein